MSATAIDSLRGILNGFRDLNSKGIYTMNATETDLLRQILIEVQALSIGGGIADGSVTTAKLDDEAVTTAKLADLAVTTSKLDNNSVTSAKIVDGTIAAADLSGAQTGSAPIFAARAWVNFNGAGTVAIRGSGNVSSITDNGVGDYSVNFTTALPSGNYTVVATGVTNPVGGLDGRNHCVVPVAVTDTYSTSLVRLSAFNQVSGASTDPSHVHVVIFG